MTALVTFIDKLSMWMGKAFAWCILVLAFGVGYEVFVRYVLGTPTSWAYDMSYIMYGALFLLAGPYTLSRGGHVRGDVIYRLLKPRTQAIIDLVLYIIFFFPGVLALVYSGWIFAGMAFRFKEVSVFSPANIPVYPLKMLIPVAGVLLCLQGIAEVIRCVQAIKANEWRGRLHDVEEMETAILSRTDQGKLPEEAGR